ncbi:MAG: hypothetical protein ABSF45_03735 [Terriglobia bacterium]|jgi:hypothetical protein
MPTLPLLNSLRQRYDQDRPPGWVLTAHLFRRFFDNEFVSESGEAHLGFIRILVFLALPGVFYVFYSYPPYDLIAQIAPGLYEPYSMRDQLGFVCVAMMVVGLVTILEWDSLFLDRLDFLTLVPLPLSVRRIFAAKVSALLLFLASITIAVGGAGTFLYPLVAATGRHVTFLSLCRRVLVHGLSVTAACVFIFLLIIAVRGLLATLLSRRWAERISPYLQGALIAGFLVVSLLMPQVVWNIHSLLPTGSALIQGLPPVWFLGLYRAMLGYSNPVYSLLAHRALMGLGSVGGIATLTYLASYRRYLRNALDVAPAPASEPWALTRGLRRIAGRAFLGSPLERASFAFVFDTLRGSRKHRLLLSAYTGVGAALVLESLAALLARGSSPSDRMAILLSVPLLLSSFVLSGLRIVFEVPAEIDASWVFQLTENRTHPKLTSGIRKAMAVAGFVPILTLLVPVFALRLSPWQTAAAFLLDCLLALLLVEAMLWEYQKIPFTCSFHAAQSRSIIVWGVCWAAFTSFAYGLAKGEGWILRHPVPLVVFLVILVAGLGWMRIRNQQFLNEGRLFVFSEEREPAVLTLDLSHSALHPDAQS